MIEFGEYKDIVNFADFVKYCDVIQNTTGFQFLEFFRYFFSFYLLLCTELSPPYLVSFAYTRFSLSCFYLLSSLCLSASMSVSCIQTSRERVRPGGGPLQNRASYWVEPSRAYQQTPAFASVALQAPVPRLQVLMVQTMTCAKTRVDPIFQKGALSIGSSQRDNKCTSRMNS